LLPPTGADITVDPRTKYQKIDGFGGAFPMWDGGSGQRLTLSEVRTAVGMGDNELGLSIARVLIEPTEEKWALDVESLREAKTYSPDVQILATPWTPPAKWKTNNSEINGGKLKTEYYDDYALHLNRYVQFMAKENIKIDVVSVQNEPDWHPAYQSCDWSGTEFKNFVRDYAPMIQGVKILVGESLRFDRSVTDPTLNDSVAVNNMHIVGGHLYSAESSGFLSRYPLAEQKNKPSWMTEWNIHEADGSGSNIWGTSENQKAWDESLDTVMRTVHKSMESNWSAYIWWWLRRFYSFIGEGEAQYGTTKGAVLKRGWAFSQYAKYVRPGYVRVKADKSTKANGIELTAYQGDNKIVIVMLNRGQGAVNNVIVGVPQTIKNAEYFSTSRTTSRAKAEVVASGQKATLSVGARSISTVILSY
jgi:O-glycosyl hydrolase